MTKSLEQHENDIINYVINKNGEIIDRKWRFIGNDKRRTPYFLIRCNQSCIDDCDKKREFWINKYEIIPSNRHPEGKWCPYKITNKSLNRHRLEIESIVREKNGTIIDSQWKRIGKNKDRKLYFLIECEGNNEESVKHQWWAEKNKIRSGTWCPECPKGKSLKEHALEIEDIVKSKDGVILNKKWRFIGKDKRKTPYFLIECGGDNEYKEKHRFWISKSDLIPNNSHPSGVWCKACKDKTLDQHLSDIEKYVAEMGGKVLQREWRCENRGNYKAKLPYFYLECNNQENHRWWAEKGNLLPKPSNPTGTWCPICNDRIRVISEFAHIVIEYFCLKYLQYRGCHGRHEKILEEGSRPDLIIYRNDNFKRNIEPYQNILSILKNVNLKDIEEIAIDFTMSLIPANIIRKCFRSYQTKERILFIVLIREDNCVIAQYIQELVNNYTELDEEEKKLIKVINFDDFLKFLNLKLKIFQKL